MNDPYNCRQLIGETRYSGFGGYRGHKHGECLGGKPTPEYQAWNRMIQRCHNAKHPSFYNYGARGIRVCDKWRQSFQAFLDDVGRKPGNGYSLDRINNDGNYESGNVRWATAQMQARNTRSNRLVTHDGRTLCVSAWAAEMRISVAAMQTRLKRGHLRDPFRPVGELKSHCKNGHEFTKENTSLSQGARKCRACHRAASKKYARE